MKRGRVTTQIVARVLLAIFCRLQGIGTAAIDLGRAHATNPLWPGHARFHVVWQVGSVGFLSGSEIVLILFPGRFVEPRFYPALVLAAVPVFGFFAALIGSRFYGGTLSDSNGIQPVQLHLGGVRVRVDLNLAAEIVAAVTLGVIAVLYRHTRGKLL